MPEYPNPEFNESKELLNAAEDPTQYPNRKWSYDGQELDVWPVTPMAFPEHKDVWGPEGSVNYSQGHLWYDPETEEWLIWQWPERPRGLSTEWYHPVQKYKKQNLQNEALEVVKDYVREKCHAEPFIADRPMPADDAGQEMYMKHHMGLISWQEMDRLRRQADFDPQRDYTNEFTKNLYKGMGRFAYYVPTGEVVFSTAVSHNDLIYQLSKLVGRDLTEFEVFRDQAVKTGFIENGKVDQGDFNEPLTPEEKSHVQAAYNIWVQQELPEQDEEDYQSFFDRRWAKYAGYGDGPTPEKWDHLRDEIKDESDPTAHPNRKWSHTYGPNGFLDVWPTDEIAYPEHIDVWGSWGWNNCSQGHLWYDETTGKWMIYPWKDRPHCLSYDKPKEAAIKEQFIQSSTQDVINYVKNVLHGEPEIAAYPMPADSRGQTFYAEQYQQKSKTNKYPRNTPEYDIVNIFQSAMYGDESIYWSAKTGDVWWYSSNYDAADGLDEVKEELLNIPEVKNVTISSKRPAGPWKKLAYAGSDELYDNLKVEMLDADDWENDKGHVPGIYDIDTNTLYLADGPGHHSDIISQVGHNNLLNYIAIDFKNSMHCVIIADSPSVPPKYLELLYRWVTTYRPGAQVTIEFNGDDETRLSYATYMEQVYENDHGWNIPYCNYCDQYGHTSEEHENEEGYDDEEEYPSYPTFWNPAKSETTGWKKINGNDLKIGDTFYHYPPGQGPGFEVVALDWAGNPNFVTVVKSGNVWDGEYSAGHSWHTSKNSTNIYVPDTQPASTAIDWSSMTMDNLKPSPEHTKIEFLKKKIQQATTQIQYIDEHREQYDAFGGEGWSSHSIDSWIDKRDNYQLQLNQLQHKSSRDFYWWLYDLDTGQIAVAPQDFRSDDGLEGALDNPDRWIRGRYWHGSSPEIKVDATHKVSSNGEFNQALNFAIRRLVQQEGVGQFFAAKGDKFQVGDNVQVALINRDSQNGVIKDVYPDGMYLVRLKGIDWKLGPESLTMIVPKEHQNIGWIIWYADERDEIEDKGLKPGSHSVIFADQDLAEKAFSNLKNVDLWQVDLTGTDIYSAENGQYYTYERIFPEQLYLLFGPSDPPQKNKGPEDSFRWSYNINSGEMVVSPDNTLPKDHWSTLNYPTEWIGGRYEMNHDRPLVIMEKPSNLDPNKQKEYEADIVKKLQTLPFLKK